MSNRIVGSILTLELQLDILLRIVGMPYPNHWTVGTHQHWKADRARWSSHHQNIRIDKLLAQWGPCVAVTFVGCYIRPDVVIDGSNDGARRAVFLEFIE